MPTASISGLPNSSVRLVDGVEVVCLQAGRDAASQDEAHAGGYQRANANDEQALLVGVIVPGRDCGGSGG
jgi:hypothetical protein